MIDRTPTVWTQQSKYLWTGRRSGYPAGVIEQGRRFTYIDTEGCSTRCRTLADAQVAAESI